MANKIDKLKGQTHRSGSWKAYNICDMEVDCNHFLLFICEMYMVNFSAINHNVSITPYIVILLVT